QGARDARKWGGDRPAGELIRYSAEEIRRLLNRLAWPSPPVSAALVVAQSLWRRTHQTRARRSHHTTHDRRDRQHDSRL
ncbi:hypothetical protein ACFQ8A_41600, partial [Streptomyces erythrochromogenes]|uniref:hypothetical protein n=1 Tax=Streptomyces erythrochromogenes TaxID=285574 RepID=UPI0036A1FD2C